MSKENSEFNEDSLTEIMSYLIKKLESNYSSIIKFNSLLDTYDTSESFFSLKKDLKLFFNDLLENFKQGIFAIKALTNQNKKILEEMNLKDNENKKILEQLNNMINENKNLKSQIIKTKDKELKEKMEIKEDFDNNEVNQINININNKYREKKEEQNKNNKYDFAQLSNVKNIMDNMKKNKMRVKKAIEQHFTNNQEQNLNDI